MNQRASNKTKTPGQPAGAAKRFWFKIIGLLIPFLILFLLEVSLRLFHYGYNQNLFIEDPLSSGYLCFNPEASKKYFADPAMAPTGNREPFKKEKDENCTRIFILGESTTIGYPYFHNASFHRWLQYRLTHRFPARNFEIINCALTAVNSYTVRGFAKQVVDYQPDAVLIYCGHNEYYGALGVGSTDRIGGNVHVVNAMIALRGLRLVQLMTNAYEKIAGLFSRPAAHSGKTRMELMVADQQVPYGSALFNRGISQFRSNMDATLACLSAHHVPVFISNLVSNEKDLRPFVSTAVDSIRYPSFRKDFEAGAAAFDRGDSAEASKYLGRAAPACSTHAGCNYYLGKLAYEKGRYTLAESFFDRAVNLDALRFRAPDQMDEIIVSLCKKYPGAHLVDSRALFKAWSDHHVIGEKLILEHVHPNLLGYALLSDAFYASMKQAAFFSASGEAEIPLEQLLRRMPITALDSLTGSIKIGKLKKSWPFSEAQPADSAQNTDPAPASLEAKLATAIVYKQMSWLQANEALYDSYIRAGEMARAKTLVEGLVLEYPQEAAYYDQAANLCGKLNETEDAIFYFRKSFALAPALTKARYLFVLYLKLDRPEEAMPYLDYAIRNGGDARLGGIRELAAGIIRLKSTALKDTLNLGILNEIAAGYYRMDNREAATKYLEKVLRSDHQNQIALTLQARIQNEMNNRGKQ